MTSFVRGKTLTLPENPLRTPPSLQSTASSTTFSRRVATVKTPRSSDAEVLTTALVEPRASPTAAPSSKLDPPYALQKPVHPTGDRLAPLVQTLFQILGNDWLRHAKEPIFLIDRFPLPCCVSARIRRARLYPPQRYGKTMWLPNNAASMGSKSTCLAPWNLTPASHSEVRLLEALLWDLPEGRCFRATGLPRTTAWKMSSIRLLLLRKKRSKRAIAAYVALCCNRDCPAASPSHGLCGHAARWPHAGLLDAPAGYALPRPGSSLLRLRRKIFSATGRISGLLLP